MSLRWKISLLIVASVIIAVLSCSIVLRLGREAEAEA